MYNNPRFNPDANLVGVVTQDILIPELEYRYAVKNTKENGIERTN
jgi:hypothetical protein